MHRHQSSSLQDIFSLQHATKKVLAPRPIFRTRQKHLCTNFRGINFSR
jgi:hypothetical protein